MRVGRQQRAGVGSEWREAAREAVHGLNSEPNVRATALARVATGRGERPRDAEADAALEREVVRAKASRVLEEGSVDELSNWGEGRRSVGHARIVDGRGSHPRSGRAESVVCTAWRPHAEGR